MRTIVNLTNENSQELQSKEISIFSGVKKIVDHIVKKGDKASELVVLLNTINTAIDTESIMSMGEVRKHDSLILVDEDHITSSSLNLLNSHFNTLSIQEIANGTKTPELLEAINNLKVDMDHPKYDFFAFMIHCMFTVGATVTPLLTSPQKCKNMPLSDITDIIYEQFGFAYHKDGNTTMVQVKETIHPSGKMSIDLYFNNQEILPFYLIELSPERLATLHQQLDSFITQ